MLRSANRGEEVFDDRHVRHRPHREPHVTFGGGGQATAGHNAGPSRIRAVLDELLCRAEDIGLSPPKIAYPSLTNNMSIYDE